MSGSNEDTCFNADALCKPSRLQASVSATVLDSTVTAVLLGKFQHGTCRFRSETQSLCARANLASQTFGRVMVRTETKHHLLQALTIVLVKTLEASQRPTAVSSCQLRDLLGVQPRSHTAAWQQKGKQRLRQQHLLHHRRSANPSEQEAIPNPACKVQ